MDRILKNIIIVNDYARINGGAAKVAADSALSLAETGLNVVFFSAVGPVDERLNSQSVEVICLNEHDINTGSRIDAITGGIRNLSAETSFLRLLSNYSAEDTIIHFHGWTKALSSSVIKAAQSRGFRCLITLHDYFAVCPNGGFYDYKKGVICTRDPMSVSCLLCNCDKRSYAQKVWRVIRQIVQDRYVRNNPELAFISISNKTEEAIKPYVRSKTFYRVDNPVELTEKQIESCTKSNIFLYIGRLSEEKGADLFCRAISDLKEKHDIEGIVVGNGSLYDMLKAKYPGVHFEGWKSSDDVRNYIGEARVLVFPSRWYEGAPLTIIEAMSAGLPCIISDCTSAAELIEDNVNGFIFESGNMDSLKEKMIMAMDDRILGRIQTEVTRSIDYDHYSGRSHAETLLRVYEDWLSH